MNTEVTAKAGNRLPEVGEAFEYGGRTFLRINVADAGRVGLFAVSLATGNVEWWTNAAAAPLKFYPLEPEGGAVRFVRKA